MDKVYKRFRFIIFMNKVLKWLFVILALVFLYQGIFETSIIGLAHALSFLGIANSIPRLVGNICLLYFLSFFIIFIADKFNVSDKEKTNSIALRAIVEGIFGVVNVLLTMVVLMILMPSKQITIGDTRYLEIFLNIFVFWFLLLKLIPVEIDSKWGQTGNKENGKVWASKTL